MSGAPLSSAAPSAGTGIGGPPLGPPPDGPSPRVGMAYIPPGALVVGTARDKRPRRPDRELPGEQMMLEGFYIDQLAYPNEEGAIPVTNVTLAEAGVLCQERDKRLCTELEWERACKGPDNRTFEYGENYRESTCETGKPAQLRPGGYHVGCQSDFGVRDMHGGPFEWTSSPFGRGLGPGLVSLRGGNGRDGEVVGRCANVEPSDPGTKSGTVGFRCCAGPKNELEVELRVAVSAGLIPRVAFEEGVESALLGAIPSEGKKALERGGKIKRERVWLWAPVANEQLHLVAWCGRGHLPPLGPQCGLQLARIAPGEIQTLAWVSSGAWVTNLYQPGPAALLWLVGGDSRGSFKRLLTYRYGDLEVGELSRGNPPKPSEAKTKAVSRPKQSEPRKK